MSVVGTEIGCRCSRVQVNAKQRAVLAPLAFGDKAPGIGQGISENFPDQSRLPVTGRPGQKQMFFHAISLPTCEIAFIIHRWTGFVNGKPLRDALEKMRCYGIFITVDRII